MVHVSSTMWRIKNQLLTPLLVITMPYACLFLWWAYYIEDFKWCLHFNLGLRFEGLFWKRHILKGEIAFEGHRRHQPWTLISFTDNVCIKVNFSMESTKERSYCLVLLSNFFVAINYINKNRNSVALLSNVSSFIWAMRI